MSSGIFIVPHPIIINGNMSGNITSPATLKNDMSGVNYSVSFVGTPTGTFSVQASDDFSTYPDGSVRNAGTWNTLPTTPSVVASGGPGNGMIEIVTIAYAVRLVYTATSGAGTLNATVTGQGL